MSFEMQVSVTRVRHVINGRTQARTKSLVCITIKPKERASFVYLATSFRTLHTLQMKDHPSPSLVGSDLRLLNGSRQPRNMLGHVMTLSTSFVTINVPTSDAAAWRTRNRPHASARTGGLPSDGNQQTHIAPLRMWPRRLFIVWRGPSPSRVGNIAPEARRRL